MNKKPLFISLLFLVVLSACSSVDNQVLEVEQASDLVASCAACHGDNGLAMNDAWPNLAGQQADYLFEQLRSFRDGTRQNVLMASALLEGMNDDALRTIAGHYAELPIADKAEQDVSDLPGAHVRARCVSCHGMTGLSVTGLWPNIAGQNAEYLAKQLSDYKNGTRVHGIMQVIASELNEQQMEDVADYYSKQ